MTTDEAYMLGRNQAESERLDAQHNFSRSLAHGKLIQPSISQSGLLRIADVGTGTGIWIREAATEVAASNAETKFSGFDISAQQFPGDEIPGVEFIKHDAVQPFPQRYHERFDLVHVRLLSYAIKAQDLDMTVRNIVQIIKPGGFLQWQEFDVIDSWAVPDTQNARSTISHVVSERVARGLTPASERRSISLNPWLTTNSIASPLARAIQSKPDPTEQVRAAGKFEHSVRIMNLETISTEGHPCPMVKAGKKQEITGAAIQLLQAGILRRQSIITKAQPSDPESKKIVGELKEVKRLVEAWQNGEDPACHEWDCAMTSIVARKGLVSNGHEVWLPTT